MINSVIAQIPELMSGTKEGYIGSFKSSAIYPDSILLSVYYDNYDDHVWALEYAMRYLW